MQILIPAGGLQLGPSSSASNFTFSKDDDDDKSRTQPPSSASIPDIRADGLPDSDPTHAACLRFARDRYPDAIIAESSLQGHCSYTLIIRDAGTVLQFRPPRHRLDLSITAVARSIFGSLVPETRFVGVVSPGPGSGGAETGGCRTMVVYARMSTPPLNSFFLLLRTASHTPKF